MGALQFGLLVLVCWNYAEISRSGGGRILYFYITTLNYTLDACHIQRDILDSLCGRVSSKPVKEAFRFGSSFSVHFRPKHQLLPRIESLGYGYTQGGSYFMTSIHENAMCL